MNYPIRYSRLCLLQALTTLIIICATSTAFAQSSNNTNWESLASLHRQGYISDTVYLNRAAALAEKSLKDIQLKDYLQEYKKIAWSEVKYHQYRIRYYSILSNNATFTHRQGATIYYLQKIEEELKKEAPYINSLNEPRQLLFIYGRKENENYEKRNEIFRNIIPFIKDLPRLISDNKVSPNTCTNAMTILNHASRLYANM